MAKLTARFDMQDRITRKIRTIRGEIDKLEKARARVNKPMTLTMRAKDMASKILKKLHIFVLKDIAKTHTVVVGVKDRATKSLTAVSNFMKRRMPRTYALFVSAKDKATPVLQRLGRFVDRNIARTQIMTILATDRAMPTIRRIGSFARTTLSKGYSFTVRGIDMASRVIGRVSSYATTAIPRVRTFTIRAINAASNVIGTVRRALFSIPTLITVTLAAVGVNKLKDATVGAAMDFEGYEVATKHWLGGDEKEASNLIEWMRNYTNLTPFDSPDLFPALSRGIGIAKGDVSEAKGLLKMATDMASITPGRTVSDAMEALGNARMGEYTMLSGFNIDMSKERFDSIGGWSGLMSELKSEFVGAAEEFSKTSRGLLNKTTGYITASFRETGDGILESMKPRLQSISTWIDNNQDKWMKWRDTVQKAGEQAGEWAFSKLENGFFHIRDNYLENDEFKKLDFEGKINFIAADIGQWWSSKGKPALNGWWESSGKPWAEKIGLFVGKSIFEGIVTGVKEGGKALAGMWQDAFKDPSLGALGGAGVATMLAGMLSSLVLSPLIKAVSILGKGVKGAGKLGGKVFNRFNKERIPKQPKKTKGQKPEYRRPWTNQGAKPVINTPNSKDRKVKLPKGLEKSLGGLGKFAKRIPVLGTLAGVATIAGSSKDELAGNIGGLAGGIGGAKLGAMGGAALGSVVPGLGTAIGGIGGGIVGGIGGAIGGEKLMNWMFGPKKAAASELPTSSTQIPGLSQLKDDTSSGGFSVDTTILQRNIDNLTTYLGEASGHVVGAFHPLEGSTTVTLHNIEALNTHLGEASSWVVESFYPMTEASGNIAQNINALSINLAEASVYTVEAFYPLSGEGTVMSQNVSALSTNLAESSVHVVNSFYPLTENGPVMNQNVSALSINLAESSGYVSGAFYPLATEGPTLIGNMSILSGWIANASGWVNGLYGIQDGATAVKSALSRLASRISSVPTPNIAIGNQAPRYAGGTNSHPGGPAIVGDGEGPELIRYPNGNMTLSPGTDTLMNLPRGTEVLTHRRTVDFFSAVPAYADGIGFNEQLPQEQVRAVASSNRSNTTGGNIKGQDIVLQITGDNHYHNEMDAEKVGEIAWRIFKKKLEEAYHEGGEMVLDG